MASIQHRERADGTVAYRVLFRLKAGGGVVSETFDTPAEADYFKGLVERIGGSAARAKRDQATGTDGHTLAEVLDDYIAQAPDISPGTASEYRRLLARSDIESIVGNIGVDMIDRTDIEKWVRHRAALKSPRTGKPVSAKTLKNEHGLLSTIFTHAQSRDWCVKNPAKGVRLPKAQRQEKVILTDAEFVALWSHMSERYKPLVWLLGATGLRWGEATALEWRDIGATTITVRQAWKHAGGSKRELGAPKTEKGYRRIETSQMVIDSLGERGAPGDLVFTNARGGRVSYQTFYTDHWLPACDAAHLSPRPTIHGLRHWAASYMLAQGADIFEVSRALGHSDISITTQVYGHLVVSRTRPTQTHAANMERLLPASPPQLDA